jgi:drug/metabolite transporter (DMT)-like permease
MSKNEDNKDPIKNEVSEKNLLLENSNNHSNYLTIRETNESVEINADTNGFDLFKGLFYMFLSCLFKSIFSILSKYCLKDKSDLSSFQLLTYRTYFMLWISVSIMLLFDSKIITHELLKFKEKLCFVIIRSVFAIISMSLVVYSIKFIHISDVYSVYYVYPAFVILFSFIFLRERMQLFDGICLVACFLGVILIVKPVYLFGDEDGEGLDGKNLIYVCLVLIAAFLKAVEDVIVRNSGKEVNYLIFPMMYSICGVLLFPIPMLLMDTKYPSFSFFDVCIVFLIALSSFLYQAFMVLGLQSEKAGRVSMVNYLQVALMYITDITVFNKSVQLLDIIGTVIIFAFNFTNGLMKTLKRINELKRLKLENNNNSKLNIKN